MSNALRQVAGLALRSPGRAAVITLILGSLLTIAVFQIKGIADLATNSCPTSTNQVDVPAGGGVITFESDDLDL